MLVLGAPTAVGSSIVDKVNVNLAWSHPNDPNGLLLEYNVIYFGYKQDGTNKVLLHCVNSILLVRSTKLPVYH